MQHTQKYEMPFDLNTLIGMEDITHAMISQDTGALDYTFKGVQKTAGIAPVILKGWSLAITQDKNEFLAAAHSIRNSILTVTAITVLLVCGLVYLFARSITVPLHNAVIGLQDIAQGEGNLTLRLQIVSKDKIGELPQRFNTFIEKLQEIIGQIDASSLELTGMAASLSEKGCRHPRNCHQYCPGIPRHGRRP